MDIFKAGVHMRPWHLQRVIVRLRRVKVNPEEAQSAGLKEIQVEPIRNQPAGRALLKQSDAECKLDARLKDYAAIARFSKDRWACIDLHIASLVGS